MSDGRLEGGERSLLGFYYQMVVTLGMGALLTHRAMKIPDNGSIQILARAFEVTGMPVTLKPEQLGQDAHVVSGNIQMLFQMKHSGDPALHPIGLTDFREILKGLSISHVEALKENIHIDHFVIITNRPGNDNIKRIEAIVAGCQIKSGQTIEFTGQTKTLEEWLRDWLTDRPEKKPPVPPSGDVLNAALYVFPRLIFVAPVPLEMWRDAFRTFAHRYGVQDDEIEAAEDRLVGKLLRQTALPYKLGRTELVKELTGFRQALDLTPNSIGLLCASMWRARLVKNQTREAWMISRRINGLDEIMRNKRILFVTGRGGTGKSVLLAQVLEPTIEQLEKNVDFEGYVATERCHVVRAHWLERTIGEWAKRGEAGYECLLSPLQRLRIANPSARYLLWIALDGLDEQFPAESELHQLIAMTKARDDMCLILSCRKEDKGRVLRILYPSETGNRYDINGDPDIGEVEVPDFQDNELLEVIDQGMGSDARERIAATLGIPSLSIGANVVPADDKIVESFKHPRMAGAFVSVVQHNRSLVFAILDGNQSYALRVLAHKFLEQFLIKYADRQVQKSLPDVDDFIEVLQVAAKQSMSSGMITLQQWISIARDNAQITSPTARKMLAEAISGGLIDTDGDSDRRIWRHLFVAECLRLDDPRSYWNG